MAGHSKRSKMSSGKVKGWMGPDLESDTGGLAKKKGIKKGGPMIGAKIQGPVATSQAEAKGHSNK